MRILKKLFRRAIGVYREDGFIPLLISVIRFSYKNTLGKISEKYYTYIFPNLQYCIYSVKFKNSSLNPKNVIYVDPNEINYLITPRFREYPRSGTYIQGGQWDQRKCSHKLMLTSTYGDIDDPTRCALPFDQYGLYQSSKKHFNEGVPWEKTEIYQWMEQNNITGYRSGRFSQFPDLYQSIAEKGYQSQFELQTKSFFNRIITRLKSPDEVLVNIGRDGEIFMDDGRHRLIIAKILDINKIPVRVLVRHPEWVEKKLHMEAGECDSSITSHPDIQNESRNKKSKIRHYLNE